MYLLILDATYADIINANDLHPTMYLLIPTNTSKSDCRKVNLHPTMYLLILGQLAVMNRRFGIYIPLCIY